jgi:hypothetical protein
LASTDALPIPKKNTAYRLYFEFRKNDGTIITTVTGMDSEVSKDGAAFADCTNEFTEIGTSGPGYLDLTSTEMNADSVIVKATCTNTSALPVTIYLYPQEGSDIDANVSHWKGSVVATVTVAGVPEVDTTHWNGTAVSTPTTAGVPEVDVIALNGTTAALLNFIASATSIIRGTVDNTAHTPTSTEFEADDITEATADHYVGRLVCWNTGVLLGQVARITAYSLATGRGHFTVTTMTDAPGNNDTFSIN